MKRSFFRLVSSALAATLAIGLAAPAAADFNPIGGPGKGGWRLLAETGPMGGRVRCIVVKNSGDGVHRIRISTDGQRFWVAAAPGGAARGPGLVWVDGNSTPKTYENDGEFVYTAIDYPILNRVVKGNYMTVQVGGIQSRVSLYGSALAIQRLQTCRSNILNPGTGFSGRANPPNAGGGGNVVITPAPTPAPVVPTTPPSLPSAPATSSMGPGCPMPGTAVSQSSTQAVTVSFDVQTGVPGLVLFWLDGAGNPMQLGPLAPGMQTVEGHIGDAFLARDPSGACYGGVMQVSPAVTSFVVQ